MESTAAGAPRWADCVHTKSGSSGAFESYTCEEITADTRPLSVLKLITQHYSLLSLNPLRLIYLDISSQIGLSPLTALLFFYESLLYYFSFWFDIYIYIGIIIFGVRPIYLIVNMS